MALSTIINYRLNHMVDGRLSFANVMANLFALLNIQIIGKENEIEHMKGVLKNKGQEMNLFQAKCELF